MCTKRSPQTLEEKTYFTAFSCFNCPTVSTASPRLWHKLHDIFSEVEFSLDNIHWLAILQLFSIAKHCLKIQLRNASRHLRLYGEALNNGRIDYKL